MNGPRPTRLLAVTAVLILLVGCQGAGQGSSPNSSQPDSSGSAASPGADLPESETISAIQERGTLRAGVAVALPWLGQDPDTSEYFGPVTTIAEAIASELGVELEYVPQGFDTIIAALQANQIDAAIAPLYATEERLEVVDMVAYTKGGYCYLARQDNDKVNSLDDINSPDVVMANFEGTGTYQVTADAYPEAEQMLRLPAAGEAANFQEVLNGQADVTPFDAAMAEVFKEDYPDLKVIPEDCLTNPDLPTDISLALTKGDAGFKEFLEGLISDMQPEIDAEIVKYSDPEYLRPADE